MRRLMITGFIVGMAGLVSPAAMAGDSGAGAAVAAAGHSYSWGGGGRWNGGARWGNRINGMWFAGYNAPGGWGGYQRPSYGYVVPTYWIQPSFMLTNWQLYNLPMPINGYNWYRYYDDAVLLDRNGRVYDSRGGIRWDQYEGGYYDGDDYYNGRGGKRRRGSNDGAIAGALIGGVAGGVIGNRVAGRGNRGLGTAVGAAGGAILGGVIGSAAGQGGRGDYPGYGYAPAPGAGYAPQLPYGAGGYGAGYGADGGMSYPGQAYNGQWNGTYYGTDGRVYSGQYQGTWQGNYAGGAAPVPALAAGYPAPGAPGYGSSYSYSYGSGYQGGVVQGGPAIPPGAVPGQPVSYQSVDQWGNVVTTTTQPYTTTTTYIEEEEIYVAGGSTAKKRTWKPRPKARCYTVCRPVRPKPKPCCTPCR